MQAEAISNPTATPGQFEADINFTSGSSIRIRAPAKAVFDIILNAADYQKWNTWSPKLDFQEGKIQTVGSVGTLHVWMEGQKTTHQVPVKILELSQGPEKFLLSWRGQMLPNWFGVSERVQTVVPISESECELRQWESMSGWGTWVMNKVLGVQKSMDEGNLMYANDLKKHAESLVVN